MTVGRIAVVLASLLVGMPASAPAAAGARVEVGPNLPVTATDVRVPEANNSPVLAEDPTEPRFVALASRLDDPDFSCALHLSGDGGRYWVPAPPVELPPGAEKCYAPELAFDRQGTLHYLFIGLQGAGNTPMGTFLISSSDRGRSFSPPRPIVGPGGSPILGAHNYMVRMAVDRSVGSRGRIHLVWLRALAPPPTGGLPPEANPILASYSDDGGETFSEPVQVSDPARRRAVAPALAIGADGALHVAYYDLRDDAVDYQGLEGPTWAGDWSLLVSTSPDGGKHFRPGVEVEPSLVPPGRVMLIFTMPPPALAARGKQVYAAWPDGRNGDPDIFLSRSTDGGRAWSGAQRLNDDRTGTGTQQYLPRLGVAPDGRVDAVFYDRRDDSTNTFSHVYYTSSSDGARRFGPNTRLTSRPSDSRIGRTYDLIASAKGLVEPGSRLGLLSRRTGAVAAWADTRNGAVDRRQDIFASDIAAPEASQGRGPWRWLVTGSLIGLGAAVGTLAWRARRGRAESEAEPPG
ncbi:MAG: sialidase family protein [Acidimicrobiales bacterium]